MTAEKPTRPPATRRIEKQIEVAAPVEAVWKALTDAQELTRWFPLEAQVVPGEGGSIFLSWGPDCQGKAPITAWEENRRLQWREGAPGGGEVPGVFVEWLLEARGGKTLVRLVYSGFSAGGADWENEYFDSTNYGWGFMLTNLRHYLESHPGMPRLVAWSRQKVAQPRPQIYEKLAGAGGLFAEGVGTLAGGGRYTLRAATGDSFTGRVEFIVPPRGFCLTVDGLNGALYWLSIEGAGPEHNAQVWLSAYGVPQAQVDAFKQTWDGVLAKLLN